MKTMAKAKQIETATFQRRSYLSFYLCCSPSAWRLGFLAKILDFFSFVAKILDFLDFLPRSWQLILPRNPRKIKTMPVQFRKNYSCFYNYKLGYKSFSSYVKLRLIL